MWEVAKIITQEELRAALVSRHGEETQRRLERACVGVAGLGGLGSPIAVHMARLGVGKLVLVDFDTVDLTNLNRQHYRIQDVGIPKTLALLEQLEAINPYLNYETYTERICPANAKALFQHCDVICEAFDRADQKAMLIETLCAALPETPLICGSGMAGAASANRIVTRRAFKNLYICGDGESDIADGGGLFSPRVAVCAAHQSTMALRLLLSQKEP